MLVPMTAPMGMAPDMKEVGMVEQCPKYYSEEYLDTFGITPHEYEQFRQHGMHEYRKRSKKTRPPVEQATHWIALVLEPSARISKRSSSSMRGHRDIILQEAIPKFQEYLPCNNEIIAHGQWHDDWTPCTEDGVLQTQGQQRRPQKRKKRNEGFEVSDCGSQQDMAFQYAEDVEEEKSGDVQFRADAADSWEKWFNDAFRAVQQVSCRIIAKEWIKTIHPKKQSTHPYNGKNPRTGDRGDPELTKPSYWPKDVIHKEPDHINKEARTKLLVHLLMNTPHQEMTSPAEGKGNREIKEITATTLKESLEQKRLESSNKDLRKKWNIVEQIIEVRSRLEEFEMGGLDGGTLIGAPDFSDYNRGSKADDDLDEVDDVNENTELEDAVGEPMDIQMDIATDRSFSGSERMSNSQQDRAEQSREASRRSSRRHDTHKNNTNTIRRPQHNSSTAQQPQILVSDFRPPQILPGWNEYSPNTLIFKDEPMPAFVTQRNKYQEDGNAAVAWEDHQVDTVPQYHNHNVLPAGHFAGTAIHDNYAQTLQSLPNQHFNHNHNQQFQTVPGYFSNGQQHDQRMMHLRNTSSFDPYMHEVARNSKMMHRNCFHM